LFNEHAGKKRVNNPPVGLVNDESSPAMSACGFIRSEGFANLRVPGPRVPAQVDSPDASEGSPA
jgi:hypothetical protein